MYAVAGMGRSKAGNRRRLRAAVPLLLSLSAASALALADVPPAPVISSATETPDQRMRPLQLEVSASSLPRFDNTDGSTSASRLDLTWLPPHRSALGLLLGMTNRAGSAFSAGGPYPGATPSVDLGFHWRYTLDSQYRIDVTAWHRMGATDAIELVQTRQPAYGARLEMRLGSLPQRGFVADRGFLGLQLDGGARITVHRSAGKPMLYYRANF
jgi:hypothetical protein